MFKYVMVIVALMFVGCSTQEPAAQPVIKPAEELRVVEVAPASAPAVKLVIKTEPAKLVPAKIIPAKVTVKQIAPAKTPAK